MGLFGSGLALPQAFSGLVDNRTDEERQAEIQRLQNPAGQRRGLFGQGFTERLANAAAGLGAAGAFASGDYSEGAAMLAGIGAPERKAQAAQVARQQEWDDWVRREQWKRDNQTTAPNDTERDYAFITQRLGKEAADDWLRRRGDPDIALSLPGNRFYAGPRSELGAVLGQGQAQGGANPDNTPTIEDGYQYTPGPGGRANQGNWKQVGGGGGNATGGFPQRR